MNTDIWEGKWLQWKGRIKQKWGTFTDDDMKRIEGSKDAVIGRLQERYGHSKEAAEREWRAFSTASAGADVKTKTPAP